MCFSATASFSASIVLGITGVIAVKKVQLPNQLAFAMIPFLFSIQQLTEGLVWISLTYKEFAFLQSISIYLFLIIAQIVWPSWVPYSIMSLENDPKRKKIFKWIFGIGLLFSLYLTYCFIFFNIQGKISNNHIEYNLDFPPTNNLLWLTALFYIVPTVISTFFSSVKRMQILGMVILLSCVVTRLITLKYFISIWCFFAAIISVLVVIIMKRLEKSTKWSGWLYHLKS